MKPGYVYAMQPAGMSIVKIGSTNQPLVRIESLASFSPVPVRFRHLLQVSCARSARVFEAAALGWTNACAAHGEWRDDLALVDDAFGCIAPAVDVVDDFPMIQRHPRKRRVVSDDRLADLLAVVEALGLLEDEMRGEHGASATIRAHKHLGMAWTSTPITRVIADRARAYLATQGAS